jgi:hypothetical protein
MDSRVVAMSEIDKPFINRWRALANRADTTPNPFVDVDYLRPAAAHLPEAKDLRLLVGEGHDSLLWLMPLVPSTQLGNVPMVPGLRNRMPHVFLGQPLIVPGNESDAARAVLRHLSDSRGSFWLRLQMLDAEDMFAQSLLAGAGRAPVNVEAFTRGLAVRRPEPTYLAGHSNLKRLRRQRRSFEGSTGRSLEVIDCSTDPHAIDDFLEMEAAGWKGQAGGAFLVQPGHAEFLRQMCGNFRDSGRLRLWSLRAGDQTLAMKLNLAAGDTLFCYIIAFAEAHSSLSAGLQLEVENFKLFHDDPRFRVMDSCAEPDNVFANRLYPDRRSLINLTIGSGPLGRVVTSLAPAARRVIKRRQVATRPVR